MKLGKDTLDFVSISKPLSCSQSNGNAAWERGWHPQHGLSQLSESLHSGCLLWAFPKIAQIAQGLGG